jgi:hypothetical protein
MKGTSACGVTQKLIGFSQIRKGLPDLARLTARVRVP